MNDDEINGLTHRVIGCAVEAHYHLGNGYNRLRNLLFKGIRESCAVQEVVYQRELEMGLGYKGQSNRYSKS